MTAEIGTWFEEDLTIKVKEGKQQFGWLDWLPYGVEVGLEKNWFGSMVNTGILKNGEEIDF